MSRHLPENSDSSSLPLPGEQPADYRARILRRQTEAIEQRQQQLAEQRVSTVEPAERIKRWERLHGLSLPRGEQHPLVKVVAKATGLTVEDVQAEQRLRAH